MCFVRIVAIELLV